MQVQAEKTKQMAEKYGVLYEADGDGVLMNANFISMFVEEYLGGNYDSSLEKVTEVTGKKIHLEYYHGRRSLVRDCYFRSGIMRGYLWSGWINMF